MASNQEPPPFYIDFVNDQQHYSAMNINDITQDSTKLIDAKNKDNVASIRQKKIREGHARADELNMLAMRHNLNEARLSNILEVGRSTIKAYRGSDPLRTIPFARLLDLRRHCAALTKKNK